MTPLYLLRHGPTEASAAGSPLGHLDLPVSPAGESRWPGVKATLLALPLERVFCSPLQRARRHAQDLGLPCVVVEALREQAFGVWDGRPWADLEPGGTAPFFADPIHAVPPGGESFAACAARALAALEALTAWGDGPPTLILAHGGPLRALLAHLLGLPLERAVDLAWDPFGLSLLKVYGPDRALLAFHNRALQEPPAHGLLGD
jgi:broad specificity phosphatase PhoE